VNFDWVDSTQSDAPIDHLEFDNRFSEKGKRAIVGEKKISSFHLIESVEIDALVRFDSPSITVFEVGVRFRSLAVLRQSLGVLHCPKPTRAVRRLPYIPTRTT
jgi:hypothetical protein